MGKFERKHEKLGGAQKGFTKTGIREAFRKGMFDRIDDFFEELDTLHGREYTSQYISGLKHILPTITVVDFEDSNAASTVSGWLQALGQGKRNMDK